MRRVFSAIFLSFLLMTVTSTYINAATNDNQKIWLRPINGTMVKDIDGKTYDFHSGEIVRVQGKRNGNIIIDGDTLPTDEACLTNSKLGREVDSVYIASFPDFSNCFTAIDSTTVEINLSGTSREGYLRVYSPIDSVYISIPYGSMYTLNLTTIGLKPFEQRLRYIPDSIYGGVAQINYDSIDKGQSEEETQKAQDNDHWLIIILSVVIFILIVGYIFIFIVYKRHNASKDKATSFLASISKLKDIANKLCFDLNKCKDDEGGCEALGNQDQSACEALSELKQKIEELKNILTDHKSDDIIENIDLNSSEEEINNNSKEIKKIGKSLNKSKSTSSEEAYSKRLTDLLKSINSSKALLSNLLDQINDSAQSQQLLNTNQTNSGKASTGHKGTTVKGPKEGTDEIPIDPLSTLISELRTDILNKESEISTLKKEKKNLQIGLDNATKDNIKLQKDFKDEIDNRNKVIKAKIEEIQDKYNKVVSKVKKDAEEQISSANKKAKKAEAKAESIATELNQKFDQERSEYNTEKQKLNTDLTNTRKELNEKAQSLTSEIRAHEATKREVAKLTAETKAFNDRLSGVIDSQPYCKDIYNLVKLSEDIQATASEILLSDLSDPYFAYKAIALFSSKLNSINLPSFYADVEMVAKTGFVIKGTPLASYDKKQSANELANLTKNYFFTTYLKTYIDAIAVLIESLIGLKYLIGDIKPSHIKALEEYREKFNDTVQKLGIQVLTVRIFESVGVNTDLLATEIDAGYEKHGAILEIENTKVNLIGGKPDNQRIVVKIQK